MSKALSQIFISGSLAYDRIMDFPGRFSDHILPEQIHQINLSFAIPALEEKFGGTAGNISYSLSLFGLKPVIFSQAGNDFGKYKKWLEKRKLPLKGIRVAKGLPTAAAYIITDKADNQIAGFYIGAMQQTYRIPEIKITRDTIAIIAPDKTDKMINHARHYQKNRLRYIFDPGQEITALTKSEINYLLRGTNVFISNDYELQLLLRKINRTERQLRRSVPVIITTLGEKGSKIKFDNKILNIKAVKIKKVVDPTGAGDAYRAGLIVGLVNCLEWADIGKVASTLASYPVEKYGTQEHKFTRKEFNERLRQNYRIKIKI